MSAQEEFFGAPEKAAVSRRSANLWQLLRDNPRYSYYGRRVSLCDPGPDTADILSAMARLQGAAVCNYYPAADAAALFAELEARGLSTDRHEHFRGGEAALAASRQAEQAHALPPDLTVGRGRGTLPVMRSDAASRLRHERAVVRRRLPVCNGPGWTSCRDRFVLHEPPSGQPARQRCVLGNAGHPARQAR